MSYTIHARNMKHAKQSLNVKGKGKGKVHTRTGHEGSEGEYRQSSTLSLTSELEEVGGQRHAPAVLTPEITR